MKQTTKDRLTRIVKQLTADSPDDFAEWFWTYKRLLERITRGGSQTQIDAQLDLWEATVNSIGKEIDINDIT